MQTFRHYFAQLWFSFTAIMASTIKKNKLERGKLAATRQQETWEMFHLIPVRIAQTCRNISPSVEMLIPISAAVGQEVIPWVWDIQLQFMPSLRWTCNAIIWTLDWLPRRLRVASSSSKKEILKNRVFPAPGLTDVEWMSFLVDLIIRSL